MIRAVRRIISYSFPLGIYASLQFYFVQNRPELSLISITLTVILIELVAWNEKHGSKKIFSS